MVERANIKKFCDAIAEQFRPRKIILFGSYAYGRPTEDSDVDLLVVMNRTRYRGERMSLRIRHAIPAGFPLDLLVRTPNSLSKRIAWGDSFMQEIVSKGQVLYEAPDA
jgi:predicted nucleotidyltransferase